MYDRCTSSGTLPMYIIWLKIHVKQTVTPSPAALIISVILPEGPAALSDFILLIASDTSSGVILITGSSTGAFSQHSIEIRNLKAFVNEITRLSADYQQSKLAFHHHF